MTAVPRTFAQPYVRFVDQLASTRQNLLPMSVMRNVVRCHQFLGSRTRPRQWSVINLHCSNSWFQHHPWLGSRTAILTRGAKSKTTVKLEDLPQGALEPLPATAEKEDQGPTYPTVVRQARNNMRKFDNCVVLTRVGSFYEV